MKVRKNLEDGIWRKSKSHSSEMCDQQRSIKKTFDCICFEGGIVMNNEDIFKAKYYRSKLIQIVHRVDEVFLDINFPDCNGYMISNYGRVYNKISNIMIIPFQNRNGYMECKVYEVNKLIHRLVKQTFEPIPNPEDYDVNHKDTCKQNNHDTNLEWMTRSENVKHAFDHGLSKQGENHPNSKYTNEEIHRICKCLEDGMGYMELCAYLGYTYNHNMCAFLHKIKSGYSWKEISSQYKIKRSF
jgi:hypothetical protein